MGITAVSSRRKWAKTGTLMLLIIISSQLLIAQKPTIASFNPTSGAQRDVIVITGTNFTNVNHVYIGGAAAASFKVVNTTTIEAIVGAATSGNIIVTTLSGSGTLGGFTYTPFPPPTITSFSPVSANAGAVLTINGTNFNPVAAKNLVYFGTVKATVTAATTNALSVTVPGGANYAPISVTSNDLTAYSKYPFIQTFPGGGFMLPTSFDSPVNLPTSLHSETVFTGDMDDDGKADLVLADAMEATMSVYKNTSAGGEITFAGKLSFPATNPCRIGAVNDLNRDGKMDVVAIKYSGGIPYISIYTNTSKGGVLSFSRSDYLTGGDAVYSYPREVAVMDLDNDSRPDIAVIHNDQTLSVFRNISNFLNVLVETRKNFDIGQSATGIFINDLDGDGKPDIAVSKTTPSSNTISIFKNTSVPGVISLVNAIDIPTSSSPYDIATGDLDNDGKSEVVIVDVRGETVSVFKNNSTSANFLFGSETSFHADPIQGSIGICDLDGDGRPDIAVVGHNGTGVVSILRNNGSNTLSFEEQVAFNLGSASNIIFSSLAIGDIDGDGIPDIALASSVIRNRLRSAHITGFTPLYGGAGTVVTIKGYNLNTVTAVTIGGQQATSYTNVSDTVINAVVGSGATGSINLVSTYGNATVGNFTFSNASLIHSFAPVAGAIGTTVTITGANFNTVAENNTVYFGSVRADVIAATVNKLTVKVPPGANGKPLSVTTNELTGYSNKAFTVTFPGAPATILPASFNTRQVVPVDHTMSVNIADIDMDGKADLMASNNDLKKVSVFRNTGKIGSITFAGRVDLLSGEHTGSINTFDFNGDGKLDIVTGGTSVRIHKNTSTPGNISFASVIDLAVESDKITAGDVDIDGKPDIAVMNKNELSVYSNTSANGDISFSVKKYFGVYGTPMTIALCDFNNDMKPDLVVANISENTVMVYPNTSSPGNISFGAYKKYNTSTPSKDIATSDVNNDGAPDITLLNVSSSSYSVLKNISDTAIAFDEPVVFPAGFSPQDLAMSDVDGDGKQDIAITNGNGSWGTSTTISKNLSDSTIQFADRLEVTAGTGPSDVSMSDLDGDGKPELVVAYSGDDAVAIFRNRINEPITVPSGINPVSGNVQTNTFIDPAVQVYNNQPYVQRHYEIVPENDASAATATITLFFSQQEFDNFNAHPGHNGDLPKNSTDAAGIANLRVYQYHGFSATSIPGSYNGGGIEIDPDDNNIVWNPAAQWWEVTFSVNGFSGFFISSAGFQFQQPPALTVSATGLTVMCEGGNVTLTASTAANYQWHKDGVMIDNATAGIYQATQSGTYTVTTSINNVASVPSNGIAVTVKPVPPKPVITLNGTILTSSKDAGNQWYKDGVLLQDETDQTYKPSATGNYSVVVTANGCASIPSDLYHYVYTGIVNIDNEQYIRLDPNPVTSQATLTFNINGTPSLNVQIISIHGVVYHTFNKLASGDQLQFGTLAKGIYIAKIVDPYKTKQYVIKFMKL